MAPPGQDQRPRANLPEAQGSAFWFYSGSTWTQHGRRVSAGELGRGTITEIEPCYRRSPPLSPPHLTRACIYARNPAAASSAPMVITMSSETGSLSIGSAWLIGQLPSCPCGRLLGADYPRRDSFFFSLPAS